MIFKRITVNPSVCGGKPAIRGLRFPVSRLLGKGLPTSLLDQSRRGDLIIYITDNTQVEADLGRRPEVNLNDGAERIVRCVTDNRKALEGAGL